MAGGHGNARSPFAQLLKKQWVYHVLLWLVYYALYCLIILNAYQRYDLFFYLQLLWFFPFQVALVYTNLYFLIPRLLTPRRYFLYILSLLATMFIIACGVVLLKKAGSGSYSADSYLTVKNIAGNMISEFYLAALSTAIKFFKDRLQNERMQNEKEKRYLETELNFLKTQIQPHFFFNTLNNLYSLTLKKSDQAPAIVLKLSGLMRYMLYDSDATKVSLVKEISYLQNYLDLEQLRFGRRLEVLIEIEGDVENVTVPPMILIVFLENSFKHGAKNTIDNININVSLKVENKSLYFRLENPVFENAASPGNTGIGLKNTRRRLELLYGNNYTLLTEPGESSYIVSLKIPTG